MEETEIYCPANQQEWRKWLEKNHQQKNSVWLVIHKRNTANTNLSWSQAVDHALCYGWIDSTKRTIDAERYKQYFCKRKAVSNWSKINKEKVTSLTKKGLMTQAGHKSIAIAKANGSWTILDTVEALEIPADLAEELKKRKGATEFFIAQSKSGKKQLLYWVISAKRKETRQKRIQKIAENAGKNQKPKQFL
ncbi:YdeI family protein [Zobellia sp. 1_MG-2023]|uniref:YdeI/OmpD-associated family protein n=1 Tax=Zobellia sp. 1_MG-2023 TaxID=3062626 RepID=UPI0026E38E6B|nr:YdeI/OmpD-associated family protein [Zobellia sp. 1_MG-2023]MDO6819471.1 YdeI/OmpD-associated family protein [Zobellia sp. 1_MG-2023]